MENQMYDNWKKYKKKMMMLKVFLLISGATLFIIFFFDLFHFAAELAKGSSVTPAAMKLYGELFSAAIVLIALAAPLRKIREDPEKVFEKSLRRYADTTQDPETTLERLRKTWESGEQLRDWCRMDEEYIIDCINGPCYANVIPVQEVVWAYKVVSRVVVVKTDTSLMVRFANLKGGSISISEKTVDYILQQFMERHHDIVVGHNRKVEKLYWKKDMAGLREYARQQRM